MVVNGDLREAGAPAAEFLLDLCRERKLRIQPHAFELTAGERVKRHGLIERRNPSGAAVASRGDISKRRVDDGREFIRGFSEDLDRDFSTRVKADVSPFGGKAGEL